nr:MAG TPA: hypothetical protein [Caudoviricetes sp.]
MKDCIPKTPPSSRFIHYCLNFCDILFKNMGRR